MLKTAATAAVRFWLSVVVAPLFRPLVRAACYARRTLVCREPRRAMAARSGGDGAVELCMDITDVTRDNFDVALPKIQKALSECTYYAFDCEMTGLFTDKARQQGPTLSLIGSDEYLDDMQARYSRVRDAAASYTITQFGLSCFSLSSGPPSSSSAAHNPTTPQPSPAVPAAAEAAATPDTSSLTAQQPAPGPAASQTAQQQHFEVTTFNAYIFPEPLSWEVSGSTPARRFLVDAGSLSFLSANHFDFNKWVAQGVPYMALREHAKKKQSGARQSSKTNPVVLEKEEDLAFVAALLAEVKQWLVAEPALPSLLLPRYNSFQRLLVHQVLAQVSHFAGLESVTDTHPGFYITKVDMDGWPRLRLVRGSLAAKVAHEVEEAALRQEVLRQAAGFSQVLQAMRDSGKPAVGHNCFMDLAYVLASFATGPSALPESWRDFKELCGFWFPAGLYDTKHIAYQLPASLRPEGTGLGQLYQELVAEGGSARPAAAQLMQQQLGLGLPTIKHHPHCSKYENVAAGAAAHEAGYDAYMTGAVYAFLGGLARAALGPPPRPQPIVAQDQQQQQQAPPQEQQAASEASRPTEGTAASQPGEGLAPGQVVPVEPIQDLTQPLASPQPQLLEWLAPFANRLNISRSDMPFIAVGGPDLLLLRPHVLHLHGPAPGMRCMDIVRKLQSMGVAGRPRVTALAPAGPQSIGGYLVECDVPAAAAAADAAAAAADAAAAAANNSSATEGQADGTPPPTAPSSDHPGDPAAATQPSGTASMVVDSEGPTGAGGPPAAGAPVAQPAVLPVLPSRPLTDVDAAAAAAQAAVAIATATSGGDSASNGNGDVAGGAAAAAEGQWVTQSWASYAAARMAMQSVAPNGPEGEEGRSSKRQRSRGATAGETAATAPVDP
ncbi:hypothetical protein QJQ45_015870 [Haematococcus lacustris]|nr:hypothetical protein QJQ45_015870 [Haematococcus lacustris]